MQLSAIKFGAKAFDATAKAELKKALQNNEVFFWDTDTQKGFMDPIVKRRGKRIGLFAPGADVIKGNLKKLTDLAEKFKILLVQTFDTMAPDDDEFQMFTEVSDSHCVKGTPGWNKIPETTPSGIPLHVSLDQAVDDVPTADELKETPNVWFEKNAFGFSKHFDGKGVDRKEVDNKKADQLVANMKANGAKVGVLYGVCTDFCVDDAREALEKKYGMKLYVVSDGVKEIDPKKSFDKHPSYDNTVGVTTQELVDTVEEVAAEKAAKQATTSRGIFDDLVSSLHGILDERGIKKGEKKGE